MQEIFFTILTIWVLYKIFGERNQNNEPTGGTRIEIKRNIKSDKKDKDNLGDYVDYEEIK